MPTQSSGFSFVELLIGLVLAAVISVAAYRATTHISRGGTQAVRDIRLSQEANKALDRLTTQLGNAVSMNEGQATLFGSLLVPDSNLPTPMASLDGKCKPLTITLPLGGGSAALVPHGLVPLPGRTKSDIDTSGQLLVLDPSQSVTGGEASSDGLRIAYIPIDSRPLLVSARIVAASSEGTPPISVQLYVDTQLQDFVAPGDYAIVYDTAGRELIRVTSLADNKVWHDASSYWNLPFTRDFEAGQTFVQKVELVTYAHDPVTKELFFDAHRSDDRFDPKAQSFGGAGRVPDWEVLARNILSFRVQYDVFDNEAKTGTHLTRTPRAAKAVAGCPNEVGFPLFKNVLLEITPEGSRGVTSLLSRRATSKNLTRQPGAPPDSLDGDPLIYTAVPYTPPEGTATPSPTPDPAKTATPTAVPIGGF